MTNHMCIKMLRHDDYGHFLKCMCKDNGVSYQLCQPIFHGI